MLKRSDLAKQFDIIVQQEIKNHNDAVLATNISINDLRESLGELSAQFLAVIAQIESKITSQECFLSALTNNFQQLTNEIAKLKREVKESLDACKEDQKIASENCLFANNTSQSNQNSIADLQSHLISLENSVLGLSITTSRTIEDLERRLLSAIDRSKKDILEIPSEAQAIKKELTDKLAIQAVDFNGLMREIEVGKKTSFILEKHIENLYTQIERLKAGIS